MNLMQNVGELHMKSFKLKKLTWQTGFTLIELIIALSIAAMLIAGAAPAFNNFIQQTRLTNATNALHNAMNLTRMEAIKRNGRADLIAHNGSWKNGWVIIADNQLIFSHEALHNDIQIHSTFKNKKKSAIAYNGSGRTRTDTNNNSPQTGTLRLSIGKNSRLIAVNFLGRIRVCNPATAPKGTCTIAAPEN